MRSALKSYKGLSRAKSLSRRSRLARAPFRCDNYGGLEVKPYRSLKTRKGLKDELDRITSLLVRAIFGRCVTCGTTENLTASHFYPRRWVNVRWSLVNVSCQCMNCNCRHSIDQNALTRWMLQTYGADAIVELFELRNRRQMPSDDELRSLLEDYRNRLRTMRKAA
jgi:hypothetical protein